MLYKMTVAGLVASASAFSVGGVRSDAVARASTPNMASLYDFSATTLDGKEKKMSDYKGKPALILNVASL